MHLNEPKKEVHWDQLKTSQAYESMQMPDEWREATLDYLLDPIS